jgi:hypothetical protein
MLYFCNVSGCEIADDYLKFVLSEADNSNTVSYEYKGHDFEKERVWLQREIKFNVLSDKLNVKYFYDLI